ncbi:hypothetical protein GUITHDRAFT_144503 [Guillardia theta CCMP2712]|uniref:WD repeat-containing protein 60 n=1 Tax=Guillardia theta (strain CCMP2712) TaxID=905079 RepID=L1IQA5_GUITC|nr:hypothetical protein GUITHDRAFT_144503 [Guillardia theta CCMP2712]EKX38005.1 hypothetical protein GUITHDRAFT_144503 [Guillardia theta CCMP2712]|eukprot:XP_005824985.1 hypothetical protein GUITHDRAFT_144503 [Guillardia theta CCMP2712]
MSDYEDEDFEEYEEDFEDDNPEPATKASRSPAHKERDKQERSSSEKFDPKAVKVLEVRRAMELENAKLSKQTQQEGPPASKNFPHVPGGSTQENLSGNSSPVAPPTRERKFVDPTAASSSVRLNHADQAALSRHRKKKFEELVTSGKVKLSDCGTKTILDMPPLSLFELYARGISRAGKLSMASQCPDSSKQRDFDSQTEVIVRSHAGMQCPDDLLSRTHYEKRKDRQKRLDDLAKGEVSNLLGQDTSKLVAFLKRVEPVMLNLLDEAAKETQKRTNPVEAFMAAEARTSNAATSFSSTVSLCSSKFLQKFAGLEGVKVMQSDGRSKILCFSCKATRDVDENDFNHFIVVWKLDNLSEHWKVLATHSVPTCFSSSSVDGRCLLIVGSEEGTISLWDLDNDFLVHEVASSSEPLHVHLPAYTSEFSSIKDGNSHCARIVGVDVLNRSLQAEGRQRSQVVSTDEEGKNIFWSIIVVEDPDDIHMAYGGGLKLLRIGQLSMHKERDKSSSSLWKLQRACSLCLHPQDDNLILLGIEDGSVLQLAKYGGAGRWFGIALQHEKRDAETNMAKLRRRRNSVRRMVSHSASGFLCA